MTHRRPIDPRIRIALLSLRRRLRDGPAVRDFIQRQRARHPPPHIPLPDGLPLLPAGEVALFAGHGAPGVDDVEEHEGGEHEGGVEDVLVCFVDGDAAAVALGVLDQAEYDADLGRC